MALKQLFDHAVDSVCGASAVQNALAQINHCNPAQIIAVGKAASAMASGAWQHYKTSIPTLIISKYQHIDSDWYDCSKATCIEAGHPLPDHNSLRGGFHLLDCVSRVPNDASLLLLVSGGASALVEHLVPGADLTLLVDTNKKLLASGADIATVNAKRKALSLIKNGRLLSYFNGHLVDVLAISDVPEDDINVIGSGIASTWLVKKAHTHVQIIACNRLARDAIEEQAIAFELTVQCNRAALFGEIEQVAKDIAFELIEGQKNAKTGIYIYGGEPTLILPDKHGIGGRAQHLALLLAMHIKDCEDIEILVAGTDGSDGPTDATGAIVNCASVTGKEQQALNALEIANSHEFLTEQAALLKTGPTGTNVMDILIAWVK